MERLLNNKLLNQHFHENGYVKFQLFNQQQVSELLSYYSLHAKSQKKEGVYFNTTSNSGDLELVEKVSNHLIENYFKPELKKHLRNYELTISNFLVKESGNNSAVKAHQDWLLVDESRFVSFNCWVCLQDANYSTGNMQFIPGSHQFQHCIRAPHTERFFEKASKNISDYMVDVKTKAGECVIFNHGVIHASRKNVSGMPRVAVVAGGYSKSAELLFYYRENNQQNLVEKYKITKETLLKMLPNERPKYSELVDEIPLDINYLSKSDLNILCKSKVSKAYIYRTKLLNLIIGKSN